MSSPPAVPHRLIRPRRGNRQDRAQQRNLALGTGAQPLAARRRADAPRVAQPPRPRLDPVGLWGITGVVALLLHAIVRLTPLALQPLRDGTLTAMHGVVLAVWVAVAAYTEGYRGFQKQFAPRVVARALHLSVHPRTLHVLLAPAFCMGLLHATRRRLIASWLLAVAIVGLVLALRTLAQPWRGVVDAGVLLALVWGLVAILAFTVRALRGHPMPVGPDVPA